jgi:hypothetical protein
MVFNYDIKYNDSGYYPTDSCIIYHSANPDTVKEENTVFSLFWSSNNGKIKTTFNASPDGKIHTEETPLRPSEVPLFNPAAIPPSASRSSSPLRTPLPPVPSAPASPLTVPLIDASGDQEEYKDRNESLSNNMPLLKDDAASKQFQMAKMAKITR